MRTIEQWIRWVFRSEQPIQARIITAYLESKKDVTNDS